MRFEIRRQKFLEALERKETKAALGVLRNELTPLTAGRPTEQLNLLSRSVRGAILGGPTEHN